METKHELIMRVRAESVEAVRENLTPALIETCDLYPMVIDGRLTGFKIVSKINTGDTGVRAVT